MRKLAAFLMIIAVLLSLGACKSSSNYVLMIDGNKISKGEYMVYLYEQKKSFEERGGVDIWEADFDGTSAENVAKQNAINSLTLVKAAVAQSDKLGIELTQDDYSEIALESAKLYEDIGKTKAELMGVDEDDIKRIVKESHIQQKVYDLITSGVEVNEDDFEAYFNEHYNNEISRYNNVTIKQIFLPSDTDNDTDTTNLKKANEARQKISDGEDFDTVQKEYSASGKLDSFLLTDGMYDESVSDELYQLPVGAVSDVIEGVDGYYIFKIINVEAPDMNSVKEGLRAEYIREKKLEIYQAQNDQWQANMKIEKNDVNYDIISINDC